MKINYRLGGILAIISAVMGIVGHFVLFLNWYVVGMSAPSAEPGCEILLKYIHPLMADFGILAGVLFAVSAYGFFTKRVVADSDPAESKTKPLTAGGAAALAGVGALLV